MLRSQHRKGALCSMRSHVCSELAKRLCVHSLRLFVDLSAVSCFCNPWTDICTRGVTFPLLFHCPHYCIGALSNELIADGVGEG